MRVIVAGAGPVGLTAALTLHRLGVENVIEGDMLSWEASAGAA